MIAVGLDARFHQLGPMDRMQWSYRIQEEAMEWSGLGSGWLRKSKPSIFR